LKDNITLLSEEIEIVDSFLLNQQKPKLESKVNYDYIDDNEIRMNRDSKVNYLNVEMISKQIIKFLKDHDVPLKYFISTIFNKDSNHLAYFNSLLSQSTHWSRLRESGQEKFIVMRNFLRNSVGINKFVIAFRKQKLPKNDNSEKMIQIKTLETVPKVKPLEVKTQIKPSTVINLNKKSILSEFNYLNENFIKETKQFMENNRVSLELFANVICGISSRQMRYLFEKTEGLLMNERNGKVLRFKQGLTENDKKNLKYIEFWLRRPTDSERKRFFDDLRMKYFSKSEVSKLQEKKLSSKRGRKPKSNLIENDVTKKSNLLIAYYRANNYPGDQLYKEMALSTNVAENKIREIFSERQKRYPFHAINVHQYCQLIDYFYNVSENPTSRETTHICTQYLIDRSYVQKWFQRQR
jgi:hypothetical protein